MKTTPLLLCLLAVLLQPLTVAGDELTQMIQKDLVALGYDPGNIQGEMTTETVVAISKFQAENDMEVTGEASPQLAGVIKASLKARNDSGSAPPPAATPRPGAAADPATLQAAQESCIREKMAKAQEANKKKRGFGSLMRAVTRTASGFGGSETARDLSRTTRNVYDANATADDLSRAAKDLGLTESELEECRNPSIQGVDR